MKLPNKNEYPDYYEVIKQPIHMEKIASILKNNGYENLKIINGEVSKYKKIKKIKKNSNTSKKYPVK